MNDTLRTLESNRTTDPVAFDERMARVLELRRQVLEGSYQLDAAEVAKAILGEWIASGELAPREVPLPAIESAEDRRVVAQRFVVAKSERADSATSARTA